MHSYRLFRTFKALKKTIGILMLSVYMLSFAELHQLLKIPVLFEHYNEHKAEDPELSLFGFLKMHYTVMLEKDDDYQRDQQLPFRDADCCIISSASVSECLSIAIDIKPPAEMTREFHLFNETSKPQHAAYDIFQPPRCA